MEGERLGSNLQGEFSTIEFPLRLREKNSCSLVCQFNVPLASVWNGCPIGCFIKKEWSSVAPQGKNEDWGADPQTHGQVPQLHPCQDHLQLEIVKKDIFKNCDIFCFHLKAMECWASEPHQVRQVIASWLYYQVMLSVIRLWAVYRLLIRVCFQFRQRLQCSN